MFGACNLFPLQQLNIWIMQAESHLFKATRIFFQLSFSQMLIMIFITIFTVFVIRQEQKIFQLKMANLSGRR